MALFDDDMRVTPESNDLVSGEVSNHFLVNGVPNGGYMMALLTQALQTQSNNQAPVSVTASFLRPNKIKEIVFSPELIIESSQFERYSVKALQDGKETIRAIVTLMKEYPKGKEVRYEVPPKDVLPREQCRRMIAFPGYSIFKNVHILMQPESYSWIEGSPTQRSEHKGWIRLVDERPWDAQSVLLASDAFPPPVLATQGMVAWVPTIEMSVQIRKIPTSRWLRCAFRSNYITDGLIEEDGEIWDEDGELVAISRQLAQFKKGKVSAVQKAAMKVANAAIKFNDWRGKQPE